MSLPTFWFVVVAILWTGFFILEGFDFGVGALHRVIGRDDVQRRVVINSVGPFWDGNEVWLIVAAAGIFAAFPGWYATWFSAGYLALLLVLVGLIIRGVSFEYRGKGHTQRWRTTFTWMLTIGSIMVPLLLGIALGDLVAGLPIDSSQEYTGNFWNLFTPFGVLTGVTLLVLCLVHGATFVAIRTTDELHRRARALAGHLTFPAAVLVAIYGAAMIAVTPSGVGRAITLPIVAVAALLLAAVSLRRGQDVRAFILTAIAMGASVATLFVNLYPNLMVSSTTSANNLTISNAASAHYALTVMTVVVVIFLPLVLVYQGWSFYVFRRRLIAPLTPQTAQPVDSPR